MKVLGIDPGLGTTGFGLISSTNDKFNLIDFGIIKTSPKDSLSNRLKIIFENITALIDEHNPTVFSI